MICGLTLGNLGNLADARRMLVEVIDDPHSSTQQVAECLTYRSMIAQLENDSVSGVMCHQSGRHTICSQSSAGENSIRAFPTRYFRYPSTWPKACTGVTS